MEGVIVPVSHKDALPVFHIVRMQRLLPLPPEIPAGGDVLFGKGDALRQLPGGGNLSQDDPSAGTSHGFPTQVELQHPPASVRQGHIIGGSPEGEKPDAVRDLQDSRQERLLVLRQAEAVPVVPLPLRHVGEAAEKEDGGPAFGRFPHGAYGFLFQLLVPGSRIAGITPDKADFGSQLSKLLHRIVDPLRVDMAAAPSLDPGTGCQIPHDQDPAPCGKREESFIFQKDRAFLGDLSGQPMTVLSGLLRHLRGSALRLSFRVPFTQLPHPLQGPFHGRCLHAPLFHRLSQRFVMGAAAVRHLHIHPGFDAGRQVHAGPPVAHHQAFKAPPVSQHIRQQIPVLAGRTAVQEVVGGHHRGGLCLPHHLLEGGQIDLMKGPPVHHGVGGHAVGLLAVAGQVL